MSRSPFARVPLVAFSLAAPSLAHGGHGDSETALNHWLEPVHLPFTLLAVWAVVLALRAVSARAERRVAPQPARAAADLRRTP